MIRLELFFNDLHNFIGAAEAISREQAADFPNEMNLIPGPCRETSPGLEQGLQGSNNWLFTPVARDRLGFALDSLVPESRLTDL